MLTAAIPLIEVKGAIPVGLSLGLSPLHGTILNFIGSMIACDCYYGAWGLLIFVAIPLPGTGVWSGGLAAIFFGNLIAAVIICYECQLTMERIYLSLTA